MSEQRKALIIADGSLATAVCAARAALDAEVSALVWPATDPVRDQHSRRIADLVDAELHEDTWRPERGAEMLDARLVHAAHAAVAQGCTSVIWPVFIGSPPGADAEEPPDLAAVGVALDRALLLTRLIGLEADRAPSFEAPVADLSDWQLADLAADLDAPVQACWWFDGQGDAGSEHLRWTRALRAVGWAGLQSEQSREVG